MHVPQLADSMEQFENLMQGELCQSRIGGRNGSNACTIICSVFVQKFLSHSTAHCLTGQTAAVELKTLMCDSMLEGNRMYDSHGYIGNLSMDEVLDSVNELELQMAGKTFVRPCGIQAMVDLFQQSAVPATGRRCGGVLVIEPYLFCSCVL